MSYPRTAVYDVTVEFRMAKGQIKVVLCHTRVGAR